ncbi:alpha/beta hydrolase [Aquabacterium sp. A7-Y]|uniref:alpha/beta fold hydrolase n=1 Tax=Aquabacterium sp. A7-Y TaxID=1349605 RepID=UPI00223CE990|nr:alpha/beta fold hydrolase [Aquabacterium sp. A7-Y]MCW7541929.1 alpha/beta hydrolase [Aquabacterium sp. A7-Y]
MSIPLRMACRWLGPLTPHLLARVAAAQFHDTGSRRDAAVEPPPLGARRLPIRGGTALPQAWMWPQQGPAALLVPGWGAGAGSLLGLVRPLRQLGLKVASFDAPTGAGWPARGSTMSDFSAAVAALLASLGDTAALVAHSVGCLAALAALQNQAELTHRIRCLVLLAPAASLADLLERWVSGAAAPPQGRLMQEIRRRLQRGNGQPVEHWDLTSLARGLALPVLVVHDPADAVVPYLHAQHATDAFTRATLLPAPGLGHAGLLHAPLVAREVAGFIAAHAVAVRTPQP